MTTWVRVPGFPRYEVSDDGQVRSPRGTLMPWPNSNGYMMVQLFAPGVGRRGVRWSVHRLVIVAFTGDGGEGLECCHINGDRLDNRLANLRWDTHSENMKDVVRHGYHSQAVKTHCPAGHAYDFVKAGGRRGCRTCARESCRRYWLRNREELAAKRRLGRRAA